jgi:chitin synthase
MYKNSKMEPPYLDKLRKALQDETCKPTFAMIKARAVKEPEHYQALRLCKEHEDREIVSGTDRTTIKALKRTHGVEPYHPDGQLKPGILANLKQNGCEFLIVVTMFNEGPVEVLATMSGIVKNIKVFKRYGVSPSKVACIVICDGIEAFLKTYNAHSRFFKQFVNFKAIQESFSIENICKIPLDEDEEIAHCFESVTNCGFEGEEPLQVIWAIKQLNKRKLNTHLWFFGGFCEVIQPKYVQLIDIGTMPRRDALFRLYEAMQLNDNLAGCCGEIAPRNASFWSMVQSAQIVEYKFAHIFDKALESVCGWITVLPGAFSAYRWSALQGDPLWVDYFHSFVHPELMDCFHSNIYLAEDRVLCFSLVTQKDKKYILRYVKNSVAETDVPASLNTLLRQRRRWINGSWFALIDNLRSWRRIYDSDHDWWRKSVFCLQMIYYITNVAFAWFMVGAFFLAFALMIRKSFADETDAEGKAELFPIGDTLLNFYAMMIALVLILSLGVQPNRVEEIFKFVAGIFSLYMIASVYFIITFAMTETFEPMVLYVVMTTVLCFSIVPLLHCQVCLILRNILHFLLMTPSYVNIFIIYAMCNTNDCTWGNRPDNPTREEIQRRDAFERFRTVWLIVWAISNAVFGYFLNFLEDTNTKSADDVGYQYIYAVAFIGVFILSIRFAGALLYFFSEGFCADKGMKEVDEEELEALV